MRPTLRSLTLTRSLRLLALLWLALAVPTLASAATTYYVRTDGGDATQCTGRADAAYPGTGTAQACAWSNPHYALPATDTPRIAGGDTLIVGPGSYKIGLGAPGANVGRCGAGWPYDCYLAKVPSGPSATAKTRILGAGYATGCAAPPQLWGTDRVTMVLNLQGTSNVEVGCLEITDRSDCVEFHADPTVRCARDAAPYGAWASVGISARASSNAWLHDLNVHGLANRGLVAGGLTDWTVERTKLYANGWAGWDGDVGTASSNSGDIVLRNVEIAWNGCGQKWQTGAVHACWAQTAGGYGDGLGTAKTGGRWLVEDSYIHHNTSDGLDLLYMDQSPNTTVTVRRVYAAGNAGNQIKMLGTGLIEDSVVVGNCASFFGQGSMQSDDQCRALGNALSLGLVAGQSITVRHNTVIGEGDCLILSEGGDASSQLKIQNNALIGQIDWRGDRTGNPGELSCGHYAYNSPAVTSYAGNLFYNVKQAQCPPGSVCGQAPAVRNLSMAAFDPEPLAGSPLVDAGATVPASAIDFLNQPRPSGAGPDIGAVELQAAGPPEVCTRANPSLTVVGPSTAVPAGTTSTYTVYASNNDSSACAATTFAVSAQAPSGWTASLSSASIALAPGANASLTLTATSPAAAAPGGYSIGLALASSVGAVHTVTGVAPYTVAVPAPTCTRNAPTFGVSGPAGAVLAGTSSAYTATVTNRDSSGCAATTFTLAGTAPAAWGVAWSTTTLTLAPGAVGSAVATVTSPDAAAAGTTTIGFGLASTASGAHTVATTAPYTVAASGKTVVLTIGKAVYARGDFVALTGVVRQGGAPVNGARGVFRITQPNGRTTTMYGDAGSDGIVRASFQTGTGKASIGGYRVTVTVDKTSPAVTASGTFKVQ